MLLELLIIAFYYTAIEVLILLINTYYTPAQYPPIVRIIIFTYFAYDAQNTLSFINLPSQFLYGILSYFIAQFILHAARFYNLPNYIHVAAVFVMTMEHHRAVFYGIIMFAGFLIKLMLP